MLSFASMPPFTDFKLYWETWGGYADRDAPFGAPGLVWILASRTEAARCSVTASPKSASEVLWSAQWTPVPQALIEPLPPLLEQIGAFGQLQPLVSGSAEGPYFSLWDLTGVLHGRAFHFSLRFTCPGEQWTPLGRRLADALRALAAA